MAEALAAQYGRERKRVVILGGGFAGINAAISLAKLPVDVTVVDRKNYHLFQPLLYQVALAVLSPAEIAQPIRSLVRDYPNIEVPHGRSDRLRSCGAAGRSKDRRRTGV